MFYSLTEFYKCLFIKKMFYKFTVNKTIIRLHLAEGLQPTERPKCFKSLTFTDVDVTYLFELSVLLL